ncbi:MAG: Mut7-C RNAse domain-containing protein [Thermofilaceae archaeon]
MERYEFVVDAMLGDLAKWLRILGRSTFYEPYARDEDLLRVARDHNAVLVTRDRRLAELAEAEGVKAVYLGGVELGGALAELSRRFGVRLEVDLSDTRCPRCNGRLRAASRSEVEGRLPEGVAERYELFLVCEHCGQVYWPGSHLRRMREFLGNVRQRF